MLKTSLFVAAAACAVSLTAAQPAQSKIVCKGTAQVTENGLITTPWCEDNYLARLAGYHPAAIRNNPELKEDACDAVGNDIRVAHICMGLGYRQNDFGRR